MSLLGDDLLELCSQAKHEVILIAPFIKKSVFLRILDAIPIQTTSINCITRWQPEEVLAGVSDLEVFDIISDRSAAKLFIHPLLHAKYFRVDDKCLIGSANLTQRGLGWAHPSNLELLVSMPANNTELVNFEKNVTDTAFEATNELKDGIAEAVKLLEQEKNSMSYGSYLFLYEEIKESYSNWLPLCQRPDQLFQIYSNRSVSQIVEATLEAGKKDLQTLCVPIGLSDDNFYKYLAVLFQQTALIKKVYENENSPIKPSNGEKIIKCLIEEEDLKYDPLDHWNIVKEWILYFLPHIFRQPSGTDNIQKGRVIGEYPLF